MANDTSGPGAPGSLDDLLNQPSTEPLSQPADDPSQNDQSQAVAPDQTPIDTLNDALDMGEDIKDTVDQVKDLKNNITGKGAKGAEEAVEKGAEGAAKSGVKEGAGQATRKELSSAGRSSWLQATKSKIAEGQAKIAARQTARQAEKAALKQGGKQLGKAAAKYGAKAAARWAAEAASGLADAGLSWILLAADVLLTAAYALLKKYGKYIFVFAAVLIAIPGLIFFFIFASIGATLLPNSAADKNELQLTRAFAGDVFETRQVTLRLVDSEIARYGIIKDNLKSFSEGAPADAGAQADEIVKQLKDLKLVVDKNKTEARTQIQALAKKKRALESKLPFSEWSARAAEELLKLPSGTCPVAPGATTNLGCASFVSYVLIKAGIPQSHAAATVTIWTNPNLSSVVPNLRAHQGSYYDTNKGKLQRGDVIWWGYGTCGKKRRKAPGGLHCHIGVYVGNDEAIHNSSSKANKTGGISPIRTKANYSGDFNGAKRYAPTP